MIVGASLILPTIIYAALLLHLVFSVPVWLYRL
jgi:hypothetical protein